MKRYGRLWDAICARDNIDLAISKTIAGCDNDKRKGWLKKRKDEVAKKLEVSLRDLSFVYSKLNNKIVTDPKRRLIRYPSNVVDCVVHNALLNVLEPIFTEKLTIDTYSSLKERGQMLLLSKLRRALKKHQDWYFVMTDVEKYYDNINHDVLKSKIRRVIKCTKTLEMLDTLIDSGIYGLPVGNTTSSFLANLYLAEIDHWAKEQMHVKYYYRYMDDMVALFPDIESAKEYLAALDQKIIDIGIMLKKDSRIAPARIGIDFVGYVFFGNYVLLRKRIKLRMQATVRKLNKWDVSDQYFKRKLAGYFGWCKHINARNLFRKSLGDKYYIFKNNMEYKKLSEIKAEENWFGLPRDARVSIKDLVGQEIIFFEYKEVTIRDENKVAVKFAYPKNDKEEHFFLTRSAVIMDRLAKNKESLPFVATLKNDKKYFYFE